jgi:hypothetical protein
MPIWVAFMAGAAVGAYTLDRFTGAFENAGSAVIKIGAVAGVGYVGWEVWKRGGFK